MTFRELQIGDWFFFKNEIGKNRLLRKVSETEINCEKFPQPWEVNFRINEDIILYQTEGK